MLDVVEVLAHNICVTRVTPKAEVCERESDGMLSLAVVFEKVALYIPTASDDFALQTDPVLFGVATVDTGCLDGQILEVFNWRDVLRKTVRTLVDGRDGVEAHEWTYLRVELWLDMVLLLSSQGVDLHLIQFLCEIIDFLFFHLYRWRNCRNM